MDINQLYQEIESLGIDQNIINIGDIEDYDGRFNLHHREDGKWEIGYHVAKAYTGNGYATEAVKAVLEWAFSHPKVTAVEAETYPDNTASKRVLEKCGFALNGVIGEEGSRWSIYKH